MTCMADSYYTINRLLLLCLGVWPYQKSRFKYVQMAFIFAVLLSGLVFQFTPFITTEYDVDLLLKILAYTIPWLGYLIRHNILCLNMKNIRSLVEQVQYDWNELKNAQEVEIIKRYSTIGKFITLITALSTYIGIFGFIVIQLLSDLLLDFATSVNETRSRKLPAITEYFIDQQKYYFLLLLHIFLVVLYGLTTLIAIETLFMSYTQHACGLFQIASYRIEQALHRDAIRGVTSIAEKNSIVCHRLTSAVNIHRRAIEFIEMLAENFKWVYCFGLPLAVLSQSINLYRLSRLITTDDYQEIIIAIMFVLGHFGYMFFCNYLGQEVIDHSGGIFHKIYNVQWYMAPLRVQKLLLFMMQKTMRQYTIVIGGLFIPSLEGFATLASMSLSYFMVIYSVH